MLCPVMQLDFTDGTGRYDDRGAELYSDNDLRYGILWADSYLADGYTREPMKGFDLKAFRAWCLRRSPCLCPPGKCYELGAARGCTAARVTRGGREP